MRKLKRKKQPERTPEEWRQIRLEVVEDLWLEQSVTIDQLMKRQLQVDSDFIDSELRAYWRIILEERIRDLKRKRVLTKTRIQEIENEREAI